MSGRFAPFGRQAALGLETGRSLIGVKLVLDDNRSDKDTLAAALTDVAARCDLLMGRYSTVLTRAAADVAANAGRLLWNHGGSGDDVQASHPGYVVSVLTPASQYAAPFIRHIAGEPEAAPLWIVTGKGSFEHQVTAGAADAAHALGIDVIRLTVASLPPGFRPTPWTLPVRRAGLRCSTIVTARVCSRQHVRMRLPDGC
jgi:ABC-type branched-subunit amino acid transport system substrate-binding protein